MGDSVERTREDRFEELFREHYGAVRGYALRRAARELAQDAVSETFLVAWRRLDDVPADALPWLFGVARRVLANQRRSAARSSALEQRLAATAAIAGSNDPGENVGEGEVLRTALDPHPGAKCSELAHELTEGKDLGFPNPCAGR